jgi:hypothetical protein
MVIEVHFFCRASSPARVCSGGERKQAFDLGFSLCYRFKVRLARINKKNLTLLSDSQVV